MKKPLLAKFYGDEKGRRTICQGRKMDQVLKELETVTYQVLDVKKGERIKKAPLPFTTSTLQQEASKSLNFSTQKTMRLAQQLYEGVDIKGQGTVGTITYLRTDSMRISEEAEAFPPLWMTALLPIWNRCWIRWQKARWTGKLSVEKEEKELEKVDIADEVTDVVCDLCGRNIKNR